MVSTNKASMDTTPPPQLLLVEVGADPTAHSGVSEPDTPTGNHPGRSVSDTDSITTGMSKVTVDDLLGMDAAPIAPAAVVSAPPPAPMVPPLHHPVSIAHGDPWQVPVQPPQQPPPAAYNPVLYVAHTPAAQSPRYSAFQQQVAPVRTSSGASADGGAHSPYLGKKDPLRDNTFADLSPL